MKGGWFYTGWGLYSWLIKRGWKHRLERSRNRRIGERFRTLLSSYSLRPLYTPQVRGHRFRGHSGNLSACCFTADTALAQPWLVAVSEAGFDRLRATNPGTYQRPVAAPMA